GTFRWMAPECLLSFDEETTSVRATFPSDIFSFAMIIYEIYSGHVPFYKINNMMAIIAITKGQRPGREFEIPDDLWELTNLCWKSNPYDRPHIEQIVHLLPVAVGVRISPFNTE
ncbi:kinase-like domain-containing protein, partial [Collybia nuda]